MPVYSLSGDDAPATLSEKLASGPSQPHRAKDTQQFAASIRVHATAKTDLASIDESWRQRAELEALKMREAAERNPSSAAAWAQLANVERLCDNAEAAVNAARQTFLILKRSWIEDGAQAIDFAAGVIAARTLANLGDGPLAESLIAELPHIPILTRVRAGIASDRGAYREAVDLLSGDASIAASSMRGYLLLRMGETREAIPHLKRAWNSASGGADDALNLALAFWDLLSPDKAILYAKQASRLDPGRRDISYTLLHFLLAAGDIESARREIQKIKQKKYVEPPEFLFFQAQVALELDQWRRAKSLMKDALELAKTNGAKEQAAEIEGNIAYLEHRHEKTSQVDAKKKLMACLASAPRSLALVEFCSSLADRTTDVSFLETKVQELAEKYDERRLFEVRSRIAFLKCDFEATMRLAEAWLTHDPFDSRAPSLFLMVAGPLFGRWDESSSTAIRAIERFGVDEWIVNNAAYALALGGHCERAEAAIESASINNYYVKATKGLVQLGRGRIGAGLRLYRDAAQDADREADGGAARCLMTLHEGMAIRHFGLLDVAHVEEQVIAGALPPVALPDDWRTRPAFVLMERIAAGRGWPWPLSIR
jgi:hypothetical protein